MSHERREQDMAVGKWNVDASFLHPVKVYDRDGTEGTVFIREMAEKDVRARSAQMISFDRSDGGDIGNAEINIDKLRQYEMEASIVDWDFEYEVEVDGEVQVRRLEVNPLTIANMPQSISDRVHDEIGKLNELPQDRFDKLANGDTELVQHPTTNDSDEK
jgi:hypothetical protein